MPDMILIGYSGFREEDQEVYLYQCPLCKRVEYNTGQSVCNCKSSIDEKIVIVSKKNWRIFEAGGTQSLLTYRESELHQVFGDDPESQIYRIRITKI